MRTTLAALAILSLAACNRDPGTEAVKPDTELYSYIPSDATLIAGARLTPMRSSPVYAHFRNRLPREAQPYEAEATEMVMASNGSRSLVLIRGKFDKERVAHDKPSVPAGADVVFLADELLAIAGTGDIESARRRTGSPLTSKIPAAAHVWAIANGGIPLDFPERSNLGNLNRLSQDLKLGVLSIQMTDAIRADLRTDFITLKSAEQMQTALRGFIGLARLSTPDDQLHYLQALDAIQIQRDQSQVTVTADWSPALVDTVLKAMPRR